MSKRQAKSFENLMAKIAKVTNTDQTVIEEAAKVSSLYSDEDAAYELQSVLNFYKARIEPFIGAKELVKDFDERYAEWRFKICNGCGERFAYAYLYDDVGCCSLDCLEAALLKIGIIYSRHKDIKRRWGHEAHPAIVPSIALQSLQNLYGPYVDFESETPAMIPNNLVHSPAEQRPDTPSELDNQHTLF